MLVSGRSVVSLSGANISMLCMAIILAVIGYFAITAAMRAGDIAAITPFRYSRLVFALFVGLAFFGERPDMWTYIGSALVVATGFYTFSRERKLALAQRALSTGRPAQ